MSISLGRKNNFMPSKSRGGLSTNEVAANKQGVTLAAYKASKKSPVSGSKTSGSSVDKSYDEAIGVYKDMLPSLKPKYDAIVASIDQEKAAALVEDTALAGKEDQALKARVASRGLDVNTGNSFFTTQDNEQQALQNSRAYGTGAKFETLKATTRGEQVSNENTIKSAISTLLTQKGTAKQAQANWQATFDFTKSKDAADRAIELRKLALSEANTGNNKLNSDISTMVGSAYAGGFGTNNGIREIITAQLAAKYPGQEKKIQSEVEKFLPNGWEGKIYGQDKVKTVTQPATANDPWTYFSDGTRENQLTGEIQKQK